MSNKWSRKNPALRKSDAILRLQGFLNRVRSGDKMIEQQWCVQKHFCCFNFFSWHPSNISARKEKNFKGSLTYKDSSGVGSIRLQLWNQDAGLYYSFCPKYEVWSLYLSLSLYLPMKLEMLCCRHRTLELKIKSRPEPARGQLNSTCFRWIW